MYDFRFGYGVNFLNRQSLLRILYGSITNKENILVGKRVSRIDHFQDGVAVQCEDGTLYQGTVVVGADGVHSIVRQEMWRHMNLETTGAVSSEEQNSEITLSKT
jgi:2-polyprenyl-6-methoxyphenol hydroxylase-like FAD-dependent oxidoreductase